MASALLLAGVGFPDATWATGKPTPTTFGEAYTMPGRVGEDQSQVIYYRSAVEGVAGVANVYLDQQFVTALNPGGFTVFCLAPGRHRLGAYIDDAPDYLGKTRELYEAEFKPGVTYYLKVREEGINQPLPVSSRVAEPELRGARRQIHLLARSDSMESCRRYGFLGAPAARRQDLVLMADAVMASNGLLNEAGAAQLQQLLDAMRARKARILRVEVEGHTDPLDAEDRNQALGLQWAERVREALIRRGVPQDVVHAVSSGGRLPVRQGCYGTPDEQRVCHAENRRIVIRVESQ
ncbi:OmpA family protein [Stenotrophomonas sp. MH1]|uniref:OmpA family protein n=1 Tax=Stenotrophomonas capsici TaxID=3110230 RepID=A0ABU5V0I9_9GAMM|nr:OmpA family protein [Stenotrophomonas sp. MH1]MEA5666811.1 OmpA family protein [Stenotrophomonas sp. MH1]